MQDRPGRPFLAGSNWHNASERGLATRECRRGDCALNPASWGSSTHGTWAAGSRKRFDPVTLCAHGLRNSRTYAGAGQCKVGRDGLFYLLLPCASPASIDSTLGVVPLLTSCFDCVVSCLDPLSTASPSAGAGPYLYKARHNRRSPRALVSTGCELGRMHFLHPVHCAASSTPVEASLSHTTRLPSLLYRMRLPSLGGGPYQPCMQLLLAPSRIIPSPAAQSGGVCTMR